MSEVVFFERKKMMPYGDIKKIMVLLCAATFFGNVVSAANEAYVKSLEEALVAKIQHNGGGASSGTAASAPSAMIKNDANMVGAGVVAEIAKMKDAMLDWLSTSELTSRQEALRRHQVAQIAANNCFAACATMLHAAGGVSAGPMATSASMPVLKPVGMSSGMPGMNPAVRPAAQGMPGAPAGIKPAILPLPGAVSAPVVVEEEEEEDDNDDETPAAPAVVASQDLAAPRPMVPGQPLTLPLPAARAIGPVQPVAAAPGLPLAQSAQAIRPMIPVAQPVKQLVPAQPLARPIAVK